jgi:hypothetical protein
MDGTAGAGVYEGSLLSEMKIPLGDKITVFHAIYISTFFCDAVENWVA